jgi:hypothetical protein
MSPPQRSARAGHRPVPATRLAAAHGLYGAGLWATAATMRRAPLPLWALGTRHLAQAVLLVSGPRISPRLSATVDAVHAASMLALAALTDHPNRRCAAFVSAASGGGFSALALAACRQR